MVSMVPAAITLPSARTAMRSQTVCRLSRSCVTMKTVRPKVRCSVAIKVSKSPAPIGSRPEVGSSRNTISGSSASARARATRLVMPPDSSDGNLLQTEASSPTISSLAIASSSSRPCDRSRYSRTGNCRFSITVSEENSAPCWNSTPQRRSTARRSASLAASISTPNTLMVPSRLGIRPMMVRISTDLPAPEPPTKPRISPR